MRYLLPVLFFFLSFAASAGVQDIGLKAAMDKGLIHIEAKATSHGFNDKGLSIRLKNKTIQTLRINVEPGLIFQPADTLYQDLVLPGEIMIVLAPNTESATDVQTFCGKSYARAPKSDLLFRFKKQGDSSLIKVLQFINKYALYNDAGQHAVWALTNNSSLDGIYDPMQPVMSNKLVALLVTLTGRPAPEYFKQYRINTEGGEVAFEQRVLKMFALFEWDQQEAMQLVLGIFNEAGDMIQPVENGKLFNRGHYKVSITFEAENVPPGNYYIRLKNNGTVLQEKTLKIQ